MAVIRFKTNILRKDKPGSDWMMWADNHTKRRYLDATCLSIATYVSFSRMMDISFLHVCIIYVFYIYISYARAQKIEAAHWLLSRSPQLPSRSKLSISIGYNDALVYNYWILRRTAGYISTSDLKSKKKRAHAVAWKLQPRWVIGSAQ